MGRLAINTINSGSTRVTGPSDPPQTTNDVRVSKVIRITANAPTGSTSPYNLTRAQILSKLSGGSSTWTALRVFKISVWAQNSSSTEVIGSDSTTLIVKIPGQVPAGAFQFGDNASYADNGSFGNKRPQVHVQLPMLMASQWMVGDSAIPTFADLYAQIWNLNGESSGLAIVIHVHCELRADSGSQ